MANFDGNTDAGEYEYDIPIYAIRSVKSPSDPSVVIHTAYVNMRDLPGNFPTQVNPREVNLKTATGRKLVEAVTGPNPYFDINNRGIVLIAKEVRYSGNVLHLDLGNDVNRYGVLDGGHTYAAIKEGRDKLGDQNKYVKLEIIVGNDVDVPALSDARNTSVSVSDIALFNLENRFDFIKEGLAGQPYANDIAYKDNEKKTHRCFRYSPFDVCLQH